MKKTTCFIILLLSCLHIRAQTLSYSWAKSITGSDAEIPDAITTDGSGNVYTVGQFYGSLQVGSGANTQTLMSNGNFDMFITKMDASGNLVWARSFGSDHTDGATDVKVDAQGNVFVTGNFMDTVYFAPGTGVNNLISTGWFDTFVIKLDASGSLLWAEHFGTPLAPNNNSDYAESWGLALDPSGNVYTTGRFAGIIDFDPGAGSLDVSAGIGTRMFISKLDPQGNLLWMRNSSGNLQEMPFDIAVDNNSNPVVTGYFSGTADFDPGAGTYTMTNTGSQSTFVLKLDGSGNFQWAAKLAGDETTVAQYLVTGSAGDIYTSGYFTGTTDFDPGAATFNLSGDRYFISKLSAAGNFLWAKNIPTANPGGLDLDASGNVYTSGVFLNTLDFDPGIGTFTLTSVTSFYRDIFVLKLDGGGNFMMVKKIGGTTEESSVALAVDATGNVYLTGSYDGNTDFDPGNGTATLTAMGNGDAFALKLAPCTEPAAPVNATDPAGQNVCLGSLITLSVNAGAASVNWFSSPTATNVLFAGSSYTALPAVTGTITYYAEAEACSPSQMRTAITATVDQCTGIFNYAENERAMSVFPVPAANDVTIVLSAHAQNGVIELRTTLGTLVCKQEINHHDTITLNLAGQPGGIYFATWLENGVPVATRKILKQ